LLDYVKPNAKIIRKEYQDECIQNEFPLDSLFQFPSLYHGETMWNILFSELVHGAEVQRFRAGSASFFCARVKTATTRFYSTPLVV
jgi:hypothetical protein